MATPASRAQLKEYALRNLGKPVIEINVDDAQLEDRLDEALQYFAQYHYDGIERVYLKYQLTSSDLARLKSPEGDSTVTASAGGRTTSYSEANNWIAVPDSVLAVNRIFPLSDKHSNNMFDIRYQLRLNDLYDFSSTSIVHYEMTMRHLDFLDHILVGEKPIRFNQLSNRLYIDQDWSNDISADEYLIIECYRKLDPSSHSNIFDDIYLKRYTTALIKRQWGQNLSKFSGTAMLGGVTLNGPELFSTAIQDIQKLEDEIRTNYEEPPHIMQG